MAVSVSQIHECKKVDEVTNLLTLQQGRSSRRCLCRSQGWLPVSDSSRLLYKQAADMIVSLDTLTVLGAIKMKEKSVKESR